MRKTSLLLAALVAACGVAVAQTPAAPAAAPKAGGDLGAMHSGFAKQVDVGDVKVAKATGADAKTVAEIVGGRAGLKDKSVTVRGKVVKFTPGVMGKNWVHLQDGSGKAADGTHNVIATTKDTVAVGDVVNAKGTVRTDVNIGAVYSYAVLIEDAVLRK